MTRVPCSPQLSPSSRKHQPATPSPRQEQSPPQHPHPGAQCETASQISASRNHPPAGGEASSRADSRPGASPQVIAECDCPTARQPHCTRHGCLAEAVAGASTHPLSAPEDAAARIVDEAAAAAIRALVHAGRTDDQARADVATALANAAGRLAGECDEAPERAAELYSVLISAAARIADRRARARRRRAAA
ncbi:hypothetical protein ATO13_08656 [Stappia sp. 22II-S9-Z10]|nr:hypothetical protein ATO13_08656 [Stappia sp. 22II-S9-Z10]